MIVPPKFNWFWYNYWTEKLLKINCFVSSYESINWVVYRCPVERRARIRGVRLRWDWVYQINWFHCKEIHVYCKLKFISNCLFYVWYHLQLQKQEYKHIYINGSSCSYTIEKIFYLHTYKEKCWGNTPLK